MTNGPRTPWRAQYPTLQIAPTLADPTEGDKGDIIVTDLGQTWMIDGDVLSPFARTLIDDADAETARATLGIGAEGTEYTAPGGTLPITIAEKLDEIVSVTGWMSIPYDVGGDHTDWLLNVIDKVKTQLGGAAVGILFPHPVYNLSDTLSISQDHTTLIGRGGGVGRGSIIQTRASAATRIVHTASFPLTAGKALIEWQPLDGSAFGVTGGGMKNILVEGGDRPARAINLLTALRQRFEDVQIIGGREFQVYEGITARTVSSNKASRYQRWDRCEFHSEYWPGNTASCFRIGGDGVIGGYNTNRNQFFYCSFNSQDAHSFIWGDADSHQFFSCVFAANTDLYPTRCGIEFQSSTQTLVGVARNSELLGCQIKNGLVRACQDPAHGLGNSPFNLWIYSNSDDNAGGTITIETPGAGCQPPHLIITDKSGVTVYGHGKTGVDQFQLANIDRLILVDTVVDPAAPNVGYSKIYSTAEDVKVKFNSGLARSLIASKYQSAAADNSASPVMVSAWYGSVVRLNLSSAQAVALPADVTLNVPIGTWVDFMQYNTGQTTFSAGAGATVLSQGGLLKTIRYGIVRATKTVADTWVLSGALTA